MSAAADGRLRVALATMIPLMESDERAQRATARYLGQHGLTSMAHATEAACDERVRALEAARAAMAVTTEHDSALHAIAALKEIERRARTYRNNAHKSQADRDAYTVAADLSAIAVNALHIMGERKSEVRS